MNTTAAQDTVATPTAPPLLPVTLAAPAPATPAAMLRAGAGAIPDANDHQTRINLLCSSRNQAGQVWRQQQPGLQHLLPEADCCAVQGLAWLHGVDVVR